MSEWITKRKKIKAKGGGYIIYLSKKEIGEDKDGCEIKLRFKKEDILQISEEDKEKNSLAGMVNGINYKMNSIYTDVFFQLVGQYNQTAFTEKNVYLFKKTRERFFRDMLMEKDMEDIKKGFRLEGIPELIITAIEKDYLSKIIEKKVESIWKKK